MLPLEFWGRKSKKRRGEEEGLRDGGSAGIPRPPGSPHLHTGLFPPAHTCQDQDKEKSPPGGQEHPGNPLVSTAARPLGA